MPSSSAFAAPLDLDLRPGRMEPVARVLMLALALWALALSDLPPTVQAAALLLGCLMFVADVRRAARRGAALRLHVDGSVEAGSQDAWLPARLVTQGYGFVRGYGFLVLLALAQLPGYALAALGVETIGRRRTLIAFLLASAAGCFLFVATDAPALIATALLLMSFALLGTWGGLAATDPKLVPYGALTATFHTGIGCLVGPSLLYFAVRGLVG